MVCLVAAAVLCSEAHPHQPSRAVAESAADTHTLSAWGHAADVSVHLSDHVQLHVSKGCMWGMHTDHVC